MTTPSNTQNSKSETSEPTNLGKDCSKKETEETETGPIAMLGKLSASALLMIGVIYVMGYVIVNGYQTRDMNYSANALQLKHLAAGLLYTFLTLFQVCLVAFFLLSGLIDVKFPSSAVEREKEKEREKDKDEDKDHGGWKGAVKKWVMGAWGRVTPVWNYSWAIGKSLVLAYFLTVLFFQFVGMSLPPTRGGLLAGLGELLVILKGILPWVMINLLMSIAIVIGLYTAGSKNFESALREASQPKEASPEQASPEEVSSEQAIQDQASPEQASKEEDRITNLRIQQLRRVFIEAQSKPLVIILSSFVLLSFSLVFFQRLYGRLKPDYGGGALYRVALHLKPSNSLPAYIKDNIQSNDSWLLLVDKDGTFVYVLRVDRNGNKQLLEIASGEIEAVEVLASPPISPADARFFIQ